MKTPTIGSLILGVDSIFFLNVSTVSLDNNLSDKTLLSLTWYVKCLQRKING